MKHIIIHPRLYIANLCDYITEDKGGLERIDEQGWKTHFAQQEVFRWPSQKQSSAEMQGFLGNAAKKIGSKLIKFMASRHHTITHNVQQVHYVELLMMV